MKTAIRLFLAIALLFALTISGFLAYSHFLVDYSLENLQTAVAVTNQKGPQKSVLANHVYSSLVDDLAFQEASKGEKTSFKDLALLELASRSFKEANARDGYKRTKIYLNALVHERSKQRTLFLRFSDSVNQRAKLVAGSIEGVAGYFQKRFEKKKKKRATAADYGSEVILSQAQIQEGLGDLTKAAELYRKFLAGNPGHPDHGMASITLANILIKQGRLRESQKILEDIRSGYPGLEEANLAVRFLRKIDALRKGADLVPRLKTLAAVEKAGPKRDALLLKLALAQISLYQLEPAQKTLKEIQASQDNQIQSKAKFYLAWVYKLQQLYGEGEKTLMDLLDDPLLGRDLELGLHAGLADIYIAQKNPEMALKQYDTLVGKIQQELIRIQKTQKNIQEKRALDAAWVALGELEQSSIYYFDYRDEDKAREHLNRVGQILGEEDLTLLGSEQVQGIFTGISNQSLRDRAFRAVEVRQVGIAYDYFIKYLSYNPNDAWTFSGLSTVYVLLGDLNTAIEYAEKGYSFGQDEYTASALGFVYGLAARYPEAAGMYEWAVQRGGDYLPARFNLGWMYLKLRRYPEAFEVFKKMMTDGTQLPLIVRIKTLNNIGYAKWKMGERKQAVAYFQEALKMSPGFKTAEKNLSLVQSAG